MQSIVFRMLSTNSLSAFSAATTTASVAKPNQIRLVREPVQQPGKPQGKVNLPNELPAALVPRGSLLNLSV